MNKTAQLIKKIRLEHHLTQKELADILGKGTSLQFISLIENGRSQLPVSAIKKICKKLNISTWQFIDALTEDYKNKIVSKTGIKYEDHGHYKRD